MPDTPETPTSDVPPLDETMSLQRQTMALGEVLKALSESAPSATPSASAAAAFASWMAEAGPTSRQPDYFLDVRENFDVRDNTNKDLWDMFDILGNYIEVEDEEWEEPPKRTFVGLPMLGSE